MKKYILTLIVILNVSFVMAQNLKFGAKLGLNIATLNGYRNAKSKIGYAIGGFVEIKVSEKIAIQPELLYSLQGVTSSVSSNGSDFSSSVDTNISLSYISLFQDCYFEF